MDKKYKKNFLQNAGIAFVLQVLNLLVAFIVRTVFIIKLGNDYLSLNGLFTNAISILSFAELGIGSAIIYSLYEPIAKNDKEKIKSLMNLFKNAYKWIRIAILILGIFVMPFIGKIINDIVIKDNIILIFILMLANTYFSYFYAYKKSLLIADQKNYIVALIQQFVIIIQSTVQILVLLIFNNYILFLLLQILGTILTNVLSSKYVDKNYEYLKEDTEKVSKELRNSIFDNIKNIFCYKIGAVILNSTDNILISSIVSTSLVGIYSNYLMIVNALNSILMQVCNSISATIGNYNIKNSNENNEKTFNKIFFMSFWLFGVCTICLCELLNEFILLWLGEKYLLDYSTVIIISLVFYITGINQIPSQYRTTFGIFKKARFIPLIAAVINIVLSIFLGYKMGLNGIFLATVISKLLTFNIFDPYLIYKDGFKQNPIKMFIKKGLYFAILMVSYLAVHVVNLKLCLIGIFGFIIRAIVVFVISNLCFIILSLFIKKDSSLTK